MNQQQDNRYIAGVVLAAGGARRFGADKIFASVLGRPLISYTVSALRTSPIDHVWIVTRPDLVDVMKETVNDAFTAEIPGNRQVSDSPPTWDVVMNPDWQSGLSTTLQCAHRVLADSEATAALFCPADQPLVTTSIYSSIISAYLSTNDACIVAQYHGHKRNPVLLSRTLWTMLDKLHGDRGLSALYEDLPCETVDCGDPAVLTDIDHYEDVQKVEQCLKHR